MKMLTDERRLKSHEKEIPDPRLQGEKSVKKELPDQLTEHKTIKE